MKKCAYCGFLLDRHDLAVCEWAAEFLPGDAFRELVDELPFSTIPGPRDAAEIVAWFLNQGWRPQSDGA